MIGWLIIACEIGFWVFVLAGLATRYLLKKKKLGAFLLICTPVVDLVLLAATVLDLKNGATASMVHGIAAIYIGVSIAYGHSMIKWADRHFAYRFADGEKPPKKAKHGSEHAKREREGWLRHLLAWAIGVFFLGAIIFYINNGQQTEQLFRTLQIWTLVLVVDFLISFSYTLFPKKMETKGREM